MKIIPLDTSSLSTARKKVDVFMHTAGFSKILEKYWIFLFWPVNIKEIAVFSHFVFWLTLCQLGPEKPEHFFIRTQKNPWKHGQICLDFDYRLDYCSISICVHDLNSVRFWENPASFFDRMFSQKYLTEKFVKYTTTLPENDFLDFCQVSSKSYVNLGQFYSLENILRESLHEMILAKCLTLV